MAQYMKKYRKVMKDVRLWMHDDSMQSEYSRLPVATGEDSTGSDDVCVQSDEQLCHSGHVSDTGSDIEPISSSDDEAQLYSEGSSSFQTDLAQFMVTGLVKCWLPRKIFTCLSKEVWCVLKHCYMLACWV